MSDYALKVFFQSDENEIRSSDQKYFEFEEACAILGSCLEYGDNVIASFTEITDFKRSRFISHLSDSAVNKHYPTLFSLLNKTPNKGFELSISSTRGLLIRYFVRNIECLITSSISDSDENAMSDSFFRVSELRAFLNEIQDIVDRNDILSRVGD
jgi:hypothetical protein